MPLQVSSEFTLPVTTFLFHHIYKLLEEEWRLILHYGNIIASCNVSKVTQWLRTSFVNYIVTQKFKFYGELFWMYKQELLI